ncbi:hypothetical protein GCM10010124_25890 [Pilimelia terevasa]|uniref:IstB-like ATP-binding domain-containing protein n=1 Tax=Pilimelia terevasa TaxID=53372 RepID=A0A8J3FL40_9ACTN|nr:ATP-binding protein [Pilimelia terevasa]GGK31942.1 hypothetical protein GCM10010124_25890 [Pilimelia terevasa]
MTSTEPTRIGHAFTEFTAPGQRRGQAGASTMSARDPIHDLVGDEWVAAMRARRAANRNAGYVKHRQARYADASYTKLRADQTADGKIAAWFDRGPRALVIAGPSRTGKTTAAYAITNDAATRGAWVVARTALGLSAALKPDGEPFALQYALDCDLLLLDDLGRERVTDWWLEQLQHIVDERCGNQRRLIVTANTPADSAAAFDSLAERYGDPLAERLIDGSGLVVLDGEPIREVVTEW